MGKYTSDKLVDSLDEKHNISMTHEGVAIFINLFVVHLQNTEKKRLNLKFLKSVQH